MAISFTNASISVNYSENRTRDPLISFNNPSPIVQSLLPGLFHRDSNGDLLEFDSRPLNVKDETHRLLSVNLHLNRSNPASAAKGAGGPIPTESRALMWDLNMSYTYILSHRIDLGLNGSAIDLLATPLSLSGAAAARHRLNVQWLLGREGFGLNGSISWESGAHARSLEDSTGATIRYSPLTRVGMEAFVELGRSVEADNPKSLRLKIGVDNMFDQRLHLSGYDGLNAAAQRLLVSPYGRTVRLTVRKSI